MERDYSINPTAAEDLDNLNLPEELQFPNHPARLITCYDEPNEHEDIVYPSYLELAGTLYTCSRKKYPELPDAQQFFTDLRKKLRWSQETAIFRTATQWCKRAI